MVASTHPRLSDYHIKLDNFKIKKNMKYSMKSRWNPMKSPQDPQKKKTSWDHHKIISKSPRHYHKIPIKMLELQAITGRSEPPQSFLLRSVEDLLASGGFGTWEWRKCPIKLAIFTEALDCFPKSSNKPTCREMTQEDSYKANYISIIKNRKNMFFLCFGG